MSLIYSDWYVHPALEVSTGAKLIEQAKRIRVLEQSLKVMTEDRDEYRASFMSERERVRLIADERNECEAKAKAMEEARDEYRDAITACAPITGLLKLATKDEHAIALAFVRKLMGEGRSEHGALDLATDERSVEDLLGEALDEGLDAVSYMLMAAMKRLFATRKAGM